MMESEVAVEPLGVGNFYQLLDELFCPIITVDIGAC
jgi:hypothetical protein